MFKIKTLEERRKDFSEQIFNGQVQSAILAVMELRRPASIKDMNKIIVKARQKVVAERKEEFDQKVRDGLKNFIRNYFL